MNQISYTYFSLRVTLYLDRSDVLSAVKLCESSQKIDVSVSIPPATSHLIDTLAAWGAILDPDQQPAVISSLMVSMIESEALLLRDYDSLDKFFVCIMCFLLICISCLCVFLTLN
jgi:hypothetical protein